MYSKVVMCSNICFIDDTEALCNYKYGADSCGFFRCIDCGYCIHWWSCTNEKQGYIKRKRA